MAKERREPQRDGFTATGHGPRFDDEYKRSRAPAFQAKHRVPHYLRVPRHKKPRRGWHS